MQIANIRLINERGENAQVEGLTEDDRAGREILRGTCVLTKEWDNDSVILTFIPREAGTVQFRSALLSEDDRSQETDPTGDDFPSTEVAVSTDDVGSMVNVPDVLSFNWDNFDSETCTFAFWIEFVS
ncbi:hypothetical protein [Nocardia sp. NPDC056100]|uniref:hypothetical protein n=1 Tax=Nocardia sp. NPDC056100 TaxID=3345712 RepID=UPI0035DB1EB9